MQPVWKFLHPKMTSEHLGFVPSFLNIDDPRPAKEQFNENYAHGGGWRPINGFKLLYGDKGKFTIKYPGDQAMKPLAMTKLRDETIFFYDCTLVCIVQPDGFAPEPYEVWEFSPMGKQVKFIKRFEHFYQADALIESLMMQQKGFQSDTDHGG